MKAAVLRKMGAVPEYADFPDPKPSDGHRVIEVGAAGVHHLVLAKSAEGFYLTPPTLPSVVGTDGVGRLEDGRRVFFDTTTPPYGAWAERVLVPEGSYMEVAPGLDDATAAALGNTGLAAWTALSWRAQLKSGETVLVLGAAGSLGRIAIQAAKSLGAGRVVAADFERAGVHELGAIGADATVAIDDPGTLSERLRSGVGHGADVIIDPVWGKPALAALDAAAASGARLVQMGHMAGTVCDLPATLVRSRGIDIRGFAVFHVPLETRAQAYLDLGNAVAAGEVRVDYETFELSDVAEAWKRQAAGPGTKLVLLPGRP